MIDGSEFFECVCGSDEHTLRFTLDKEDKEIYTSIFIGHRKGFLKRLWFGIKYILGYTCKYGHFENTILQSKDAKRLMDLLNEIQN